MNVAYPSVGALTLLDLAVRLLLVLSVPLAEASAAGCPVRTIPKISHTHAPTNPQLVYLLDPAKYPQAVCNDGTQGGYIFRPGTGYGSRRWIVVLPHPDMCQTNQTCYIHPNNLISTKGLVSGVSPGPAMDALLSADPAVNPDFYDANAVTVLYCSSDYFTGDKAPVLIPFDKKNAAQTWYFRGRAIAEAAVQDLVWRQGLDHAKELLFSGDSSGGYGVIVNANDLLPLVPRGVRTLFATDGGFLQDIGGFDAASPNTGYVSAARPTPVETLLTTGHDFWGGRGDRLCTAQATTISQQIQCYISGYLVSTGYVPRPVFAAEALDDTAQLKIDGMTNKDPEKGTPEAGYAFSFAQAMTGLVLSEGAYNGAFSPYAFAHQLFDSAQIFNMPYGFPGPSRPRRARR